MKITKEQFAAFVKQIIVANSLDFPSIARSQGLNWFADILPAINVNKSFKLTMEETLSDFKYKLLDGVYQIAHDGKPRAGRTVEVSYVKEVIKYIDSGALLGAIKEEAEAEIDDSALKRHLARLNLGDSNESE